MFSGSVARGGGQLPSQMNDHRRVQGNRNAEQNSAYELLRPVPNKEGRVFRSGLLVVTAWVCYLFVIVVIIIVKGGKVPFRTCRNFRLNRTANAAYQEHHDEEQDHH